MVHSGYSESGRLCSPLVSGVMLFLSVCFLDNCQKNLVWPKLSEKFGHGIREQKRVFFV